MQKKSTMMFKIIGMIRRVNRIALSHALVPFLLAWMATGGYILMVKYLGFYWDDCISTVYGQCLAVTNHHFR